MHKKHFSKTRFFNKTSIKSRQTFDTFFYAKNLTIRLNTVIFILNRVTAS